MEGAGDVDGDQKSASIGVCASITANIGTAAIAAKATIAMQATMTTVEREVTSPFYRTDARTADRLSTFITDPDL